MTPTRGKPRRHEGPRRVASAHPRGAPNANALRAELRPGRRRDCLARQRLCQRWARGYVQAPLAFPNPCGGLKHPLAPRRCQGGTAINTDGHPRTAACALLGVPTATITLARLVSPPQRAPPADTGESAPAATGAIRPAPARQREALPARTGPSRAAAVSLALGQAGGAATVRARAGTADDAVPKAHHNSILESPLEAGHRLLEGRGSLQVRNGEGAHPQRLSDLPPARSRCQHGRGHEVPLVQPLGDVRHALFLYFPIIQCPSVPCPDPSHLTLVAGGGA